MPHAGELELKAESPVFVPAVFANGWVNFNSGYNTAGYYKDLNGFVHLKGLISTGTIGQPAFVLPLGFRPQADCLFPAVANMLYATLYIQANGAVVPFNGSNAFFSLEGAIFKAI